MGDKAIIVYTQHHCPQCQDVKAFLKQRGLAFEEKNVMDDKDAMAELMELGVMSVPVTIVGGEDVVLGFNRKRLEALLA